MSTQNSLVIIKEKIAGVMLDDKRMKADDIAKKVLKGRKTGMQHASKVDAGCISYYKGRVREWIMLLCETKEERGKEFLLLYPWRRSLYGNQQKPVGICCDCGRGKWIWCGCSDLSAGARA